MRKKKTKEGLAKKETSKPCLQIALTKTTLFQNQRNERKKNILKTNLAKNRCGCSSHVFPLWKFHLLGFHLHVFIPSIINMYNIILNNDNILLNMNMRNNKLNKNHAH